MQGNMMAGVKTTSRIEGLNAIIKKQLNSKSSLVETFEKIENLIQKSEKFLVFHQKYKSKNTYLIFVNPESKLK